MKKMVHPTFGVMRFNLLIINILFRSTLLGLLYLLRLKNMKVLI